MSWIASLCCCNENAKTPIKELEAAFEASDVEEITNLAKNKLIPFIELIKFVKKAHFIKHNNAVSEALETQMVLRVQQWFQSNQKATVEQVEKEFSLQNVDLLPRNPLQMIGELNGRLHVNRVQFEIYKSLPLTAETRKRALAAKNNDLVLAVFGQGSNPLAIQPLAPLEQLEGQ